MRRMVFIVILVLQAAGCAKAPSHVPAHPVVLWSSGAVVPEFPVPPEAAWRPVYQRLRRKLARRSGSNAQWVCFSSGRLDTVVAFYAHKYGMDPHKLVAASTPAPALFQKIRQVAAGLGYRVPSVRTRRGQVRIVIVPQRGDRPRVRLESPFLNLQTGRTETGTLISMRWRKPRPYR